MKKLILLLTILFTQIIVAQSFEETKRLAEDGDVKAQYNLGVFYDIGEGTLKAHKRLVYWHTETTEQDYAKAQYNLGICYENGNGTLKDSKKSSLLV
jgi:hypothetical protein